MGSNSKFQKTSLNAGLRSRCAPFARKPASPGPPFPRLPPVASLAQRAAGVTLGLGWEPRVRACSVTSASVTPASVAHQAPLSMEFSRQKYWSGLPFPSPGGLPDPETEPTPPALAGRVFTTAPLGEARGVAGGKLALVPQRAGRFSLRTSSGPPCLPCL